MAYFEQGQRGAHISMRGKICRCSASVMGLRGGKDLGRLRLILGILAFLASSLVLAHRLAHGLSGRGLGCLVLGLLHQELFAEDYCLLLILPCRALMFTCHVMCLVMSCVFSYCHVEHTCHTIFSLQSAWHSVLRHTFRSAATCAATVLPGVPCLLLARTLLFTSSTFWILLLLDNLL